MDALIIERFAHLLIIIVVLALAAIVVLREDGFVFLRFAVGFILGTLASAIMILVFQPAGGIVPAIGTGWTLVALFGPGIVLGWRYARTAD